MKIKAGRVWQIEPCARRMVAEGRAVGSKGKYRLGRLPDQLFTDFKRLDAEHGDLVRKHGTQVFEDEDKKVLSGWSVAPGSPAFEAFAAEWDAICEEEIEVAVEPIPLSQLDVFEPKHLAPGQLPKKEISEQEFQILGELVFDDTAPI